MKASARTLLRVELQGVDLPGRSCGPRPRGGWYEDIQVGLKRGTTAIDLVPGDAPEAKWSMEVTVREIENSRDFGGRWALARGARRAHRRRRLAALCPCPSTSDYVVDRNPDRSAHSSESGS